MKTADSMTGTRHSLHAALVHFPIALLPAHLAFHLFEARLGRETAAVGGFWLLLTGVSIGWLAVVAAAKEAIDLLEKSDTRLTVKLLWHGCSNGTVLLGFTALLAWEYQQYPNIEHGSEINALEGAAIMVMFASNHIGGTITRNSKYNEIY